jgi:hypothetical protein
MPKGKKKNKPNVLKGVITKLDSPVYFTVDEKKTVRVGPKTEIRGVAVDVGGLLVGQQVSAVGEKKNDVFNAKKINVTNAGGVEPEEPEEEEPEPTPEPEPEPEPTPEPEPAPGDETPPPEDENNS